MPAFAGPSNHSYPQTSGGRSLNRAAHPPLPCDWHHMSWGGLPLRTRARTPYRDLHPQKSLLAQRPNPKRYPNTEVPEECVEQIRDSGLNGRPPDHAVNRIRLLNVSEACDWSASAFTQHLAELLIKSKSIKGRQEEEEEDEEDGRGKCT